MKYRKYIALALAFIGLNVIYAQEVEKDTTLQEQNELIDIAFGKQTKARTVGAIDVISGEDLTRVSNNTVNIKGLAAGLSGTNRVRGWSRGSSGGTALFIVDGVAHRSIGDLVVEEIESIQVLKDATAKILYGSKAANGVIVITTKRGNVGSKKVKVSAEYGINTPTIKPSFLNSGDYAALYRQAETNDELPFYTYSEEDIAAYKDPNADRILYPDVNFHDEFMKDYKQNLNVNAQLSGGDEKTKYFINLAFNNSDGIISEGEKRTHNTINVRSNLDYVVNDILSVNIDIAGRINAQKGPHMSESSVFGSLASHRPNDYPLYVSQYNDLDSLGFGRGRVNNNLIGELARKGYRNTENYYMQNKLGLNLDLNKYVSGLTASAYVSFDILNHIKTGKNLTYSRIRVDGQDMTRVGSDDVKGNEERFAENFTRNVGGTVTVNYDKTFGKHSILTTANYIRQTNAKKSQLDGRAISQDDKSMNAALRLNYAFDNKYVIEGSATLLGSDKFTKDNRWGTYGAAGVGWVISEEGFLKGSSMVNYLKLKASYGVMGYDWNYPYFNDRDEFVKGGSFWIGVNNSSNQLSYVYNQMGFSGLSFEESTETNIGIEGLLFNSKLGFEVNYFNEVRSGMLARSTNAIPGYILGNASAPYMNLNEVKNQGIDLAINYGSNIGDFYYSIGANMMYSKAENVIYDELYDYEHLRRQGKETDAIFGYVADGLYPNQAAIDEHGVSSSFGIILPGDIRYKNITNDREDDIIDAFDREVIGNSTPRINYALNVDLKYKGFTLYALGQGRGGNDLVMNNYYQNYGGRKYSEHALGAANPTDESSIASATHPRLTTFSGNSAHSYRTSTYWLKNGAYFKLRTVQLGYDLPENVAKVIGAAGVNIYCRGNDILTISDITDMDPESLNAGISTSPLYRSYMVGVKMTF